LGAVLSAQEVGPQSAPRLLVVTVRPSVLLLGEQWEPSLAF
jgi:hypothetical protein